MDFSSYFSQAEEILFTMSRTANQNLDLTASAQKKDRMVDNLDSETASKLVRRNFEKAYTYIYQNRNLPIFDRDDIFLLVENVASIINRDLVKETYFYRVDDSKKYPYTFTRDLSVSIEDFYNQFLIGLHLAKDPVYLAALIEWRIDLRDHFFVDSCGKIARALSHWVLMRADLPLPDLTFSGLYSREEAKKKYYAFMPHYRRLENQVQDDLDFFKFLYYYTKLIKRP